jgi:hypothetical protein
MARGKVFISYRREDAAGEAGRLYDHLAPRLGREHVFLDIGTIAPGWDFVRALDQALAETDVVLVLIGRTWLGARDAQGQRRLDDPTDFVHREILAALQRGVRTIPVLVQNATMPAGHELPPPLAELAKRQAVAIQHEEFADDVERLLDSLGVAMPPAAPRRPWKSIAGGLVAILLGAIFVAQRCAAARDQRRDVGDLLRVAGEQRARRQFDDALTTLEQALSKDVDQPRVRAESEDVAMEWIRELRWSDGPDPQRFADALPRPIAVLDQASPDDPSHRRADRMAHIGWATFLRWRDGERALDPEAHYQKALAIDPDNPYANAMLGHWRLWTGGSLEIAMAAFRCAAASGRAADAVSGYQFAALDNARTPAADLELVRLADAARRGGHALPADKRRRVWSRYALPADPDPILEALPAMDHTATFRWLFDADTRADADHRRIYTYYLARLAEAGGQKHEALRALRGLAAELGGMSGPLVDRTQETLARLEGRAR